MKINKSMKLFGIMLLALNIAVGCASAPEESKPEPAPAPVKQEPVPVVEAAPTTSSYEVIAGDNLWNISGKSSVYGNPYQWPLIYKANSDQIKDADLIFPGQTLAIDTNPSDADAAAAIQHAKTRGSWSIGAVEDSDKAYLGK